MLLTVGFGRHLPPGTLAGFVTRHRAVHAERLAAYEGMRAQADAAGADVDPYVLATVDFGISYERAVLGWFDALPPEIAGT